MEKQKRASASVVRAELNTAKKRWGWSNSDIVNVCKGGGTSAKGSSYEREICKQLSLWWTGGAREDIFWRSSGSGARAKVRGRAGRDTAGQHGDIAATDPIGAPFIKAFTVELKRGYSEHTVQDMMDKLPGAGVQPYENFFAQTIESHQQAGSYSWLLITRRDRRSAMVWLPMLVYRDLCSHYIFKHRPCPYVGMRVSVRCQNKVLLVNVCGMVLGDFLAEVTPDIVRIVGRC